MSNVNSAAGSEWRRLADAVARKSVYLQPGRVAVCAEPSLITTILGSCVAICLWDSRLHVGGMNHYMLPFEISPQNSSARFGSAAWKELVGRMLELGARREHLRAAVFGGACVMESMRTGGGHIGSMNVRLADTMLGSEGIQVVHRDVDGCHGRKLLYETDSGRFTVHTL